MYILHNSYYVTLFVSVLTINKVSMIKLSFRQVLRLAHSLNSSVNFYFYSARKLKVFFFFGDFEFDSNPVSLDYAKKYYPLIMGENLYNFSIISKL